VSSAAAVSIALVLSSSPGQEPPSFPSEVANVYVDVFVTHRGHPVLGLAAENFEIRDNGVRQQARLMSSDAAPVVVLLVLDISRSVAGEALGHLRAAGHAVLDGLRPGERAALITFNQEVVVRVPPSDDLPRLRKALDSIRAHGATSLHDAAYTALTLPIPGARPVVFLFSDGEDNTSWLGAEAVLSVAARTDVLLQAVGPTETTVIDFKGRGGNVQTAPTIRNVPSQRADDLRRIAESTGGRFWKAEKTEHLKGAFLAVLEELRTRYLLAFQPTGVEGPGEHGLEVRLKGAKGKVRSRSRYFVPPPR
jgi:VWFA-related protein